VDILRPAQKGDPNAGPDRRRLPGELGAFRFELGDRGVDAGDAQPDMLKPEIGRLRRGRDGARRNLRDKTATRRD
jgi:hypothetical protein